MVIKMAENRKYSCVEDVIKEQRKYCDLLKNTTEIVFGVDEENQELVKELQEQLGFLNTEIKRLKTALTEVKAKNDELQNGLATLVYFENFASTLEINPDFQKLYKTPKQEGPRVPNSERKRVQRALVRIRDLTSSELENVPFYTKGRLKLDDINEFIAGVNSTLIKKYSILKAQNAKYEDRLLQQVYKNQQRACPGLIFFVEEDLKKFGFIRSTVPMSKMLNILRVTHRVKDIRSDGFVRYGITES